MAKIAKLHFRNTRLYVNGGISVAECVARRNGPLDLERGTGVKFAPGVTRAEIRSNVTCKLCLREMDKAGQ
jgi:hypothetical protein